MFAKISGIYVQVARFQLLGLTLHQPNNQEKFIMEQGCSLTTGQLIKPAYLFRKFMECWVDEAFSLAAPKLFN